MSIDEDDARTSPEVRGTGLGLVKGLGVTLKHALRPSITQQYPEEKPDLPPRTRGVIALKQANCTVCWKCSRECPDWCIYIEAHKETHHRVLAEEIAKGTDRRVAEGRAKAAAVRAARKKAGG